MEGFSITPQVEDAAKKLMNGTLSIEEYAEQIKQKFAERQAAN
jgi:hypothetical protein